MNPKTWVTLGLSTFGLLCGATAAVASESDKRAYVIDTENQFAPVEITQGAPRAEKKVVLRDPNLKDLGKLAKPLGKKTTDAPKKFVAKTKSDPKAIVFKALSVTGQRTQPRVEFTRETLSIGRSDEPLSSDFFEKVFEPISDNDF